MDENDTILGQDYAIPFAAWELRLYLNSHPDDHCALRMYHELLDRGGCGNYASVYGDCSHCGNEDENALGRFDEAAASNSSNLDNYCGTDETETRETSCAIRWTWVDGPWPWEYGASADMA